MNRRTRRTTSKILVASWLLSLCNRSIVRSAWPLVDAAAASPRIARSIRPQHHRSASSRKLIQHDDHLSTLTSNAGFPGFSRGKVVSVINSGGSGNSGGSDNDAMVDGQVSAGEQQAIMNQSDQPQSTSSTLSQSQPNQATLPSAPPSPPKFPLDFGDVRRAAARSTRAARSQIAENWPTVASGMKAQLKGSFYGISPDIYGKVVTNDGRPPSVSDNLSEALMELKSMRLEMETMRREMQMIKKGMVKEGYISEDDMMLGHGMSDGDSLQRQRDYDRMAAEIESWAESLLAQGEDDGWKPVNCNKVMRKSLNKDGGTRMFLKWMKDSRGKDADADDEAEYPCMKVFGTINAPLEDVCTYLAQEETLPEYNDLIVEHKDVEVLAAHSKICWSQTPQILFLKPRDFVTFCHHRWKRDGTSVIVNQAVDHPSIPGNNEDNGNKACRAYALRGANFMSKCPSDPNKTNIVMVAHANPGGGVPKWAVKTAINTLAPIEPFKLFHKIDVNVQECHSRVKEWIAQGNGPSTSDGRSTHPAGIAQMGYACFWPKGGGKVESSAADTHTYAESDTFDQS